MRRLCRKAGVKSPTTDQWIRIMTTPRPDGSPSFAFPDTWNLEAPDGHFQSEMVPRLERVGSNNYWTDAHRAAAKNAPKTPRAKTDPKADPKGKAKAGSLVLVVSEEMVADPKVSKNIESAIAYVGGRCETLFSGVYVRKNVPGLIAILSMNGLAT